MAKHYVKCGELEYITDKNIFPIQAALEGLRKTEVMFLPEVITVDERGFREKDTAEHWYNTEVLLHSLGL